MENNSVDFKDVYVDVILSEIKEEVQKVVKLEETQTLNRSYSKMERADDLMREVLKDILCNLESCGNSKYNFSLLANAEEEETKKQLRQYLSFYYVALYSNKVNLLQELIRNKVDLKYSKTQLFCLFDPDLLSMVDEKAYVEFAKRTREVIGDFYDSIYDLEQSERIKYLKKFVNIVNGRSEVYTRRYTFAFRKWSFDIYDEETYLKVTDNQLGRAVGHFTNYTNEQNILRINNLLQNPLHCGSCRLYSDLMLNLFSDEELLNINDETYSYFVRAKHEESDYLRLANLYRKNKNIVNYPITYSALFLGTFTDEEIIAMTEEDLCKMTNSTTINNYVRDKKIHSLKGTSKIKALFTRSSN